METYKSCGRQGNLETRSHLWKRSTTVEDFQAKRKLLDYLPGDKSSVMDRGARLVSLSFTKYNPSTDSASGKKSCIENQGTLLVNSAMIICKLADVTLADEDISFAQRTVNNQ